jgi:hypothetical protein
MIGGYASWEAKPRLGRRANLGQVGLGYGRLGCVRLGWSGLGGWVKLCKYGLI